jgi:beta-N-acetylhexosaminidase
MKHLPLIDSIAQLFMVGFSGSEADEQLIALIEEHRLTSFILFKHNARDSAGMRSMINSARKRAASSQLPPLLFAADEEGGLISPLGGVVGRLPSAMALAAGNSRDRARLAVERVGRRLRAAGLDLVLAPVLDVNSEPTNPVIGTRSFGDNRLMVAAYGTAVITGFRSAGLLCCAKHFPGHGRTSKDSHLELPVVDASAEEMLGDDLVPFYRACQLDVDAAMTAHVAYSKLDDVPGRPSTVSTLIQTGILRNELRFKGTLLSDSMEMKGLAGVVAPEDACVDAIRAGVDMFICVDPHLAPRCASRIEKALNNGDLTAEILDRALSNVASLKRRAVDAAGEAGGGAGTVESESHRPVKDSLQEILDECYEASITAVNWSGTTKRELSSTGRGLLLLPDGLPGYEATDPYLVSVGLVALGLGDRWQVLAYPFDPSEGDVGQIAERIRNSEDVVLCTLSRGPEPPGQRRLVKACLESGRLRLAVALLDPYMLGRLPAEIPGAASYGFWPECLRALVEAVFGGKAPQGLMPVDIPERK